MKLSKAFGLTAFFLTVAGGGATYANASECVPAKCEDKVSFFHLSKSTIFGKQLKLSCEDAVQHWDDHSRDRDPSNASNIYGTNFASFDYCTNASSIYPGP